MPVSFFYSSAHLAYIGNGKVAPAPVMSAAKAVPTALLANVTAMTATVLKNMRSGFIKYLSTGVNGTGRTLGANDDNSVTVAPPPPAPPPAWRCPPPAPPPDLSEGGPRVGGLPAHAGRQGRHWPGPRYDPPPCFRFPVSNFPVPGSTTCAMAPVWPQSTSAPTVFAWKSGAMSLATYNGWSTSRRPCAWATVSTKTSN